ncbi:hypothetical protein [Cryobacterium sp. Hb1]|uniref:hypothetical protein n=1 Tax=Cryobacterium sp. Hb1 TaxID=1259147 RepID=UPI001069BDC2|nr:hypothetical protein [Cryobacterium sp. Hb1]TFD68536.1 hypothetical protein E3T38_09215 [Cryobacterium sp. Hb1]
MNVRPQSHGPLGLRWLTGQGSIIQTSSPAMHASGWPVLARRAALFALLGTISVATKTFIVLLLSLGTSLSE